MVTKRPDLPMRIAEPAPQRAAVPSQPVRKGKAQPGADRMQTGADRMQTGADRMQTGADRLQTGADRLRTSAASAAGASPPRLASAAQNALDSLVRETIPRLVAEREILHPVLARVLGQPEPLAALESEMTEIGIETERLGALVQHLGSRPVRRSERRVLERILTDLSCLLEGHSARVTSLSAKARSVDRELDAGWDALARVLEEAEWRAIDAVVLVVRPEVSSQAAIVMRHNPAANRAYAVTLGDLTRARGIPQS